MEHAEVYALEAASAPLSPKSVPDKSQTQPLTPSDPPRSQQQTPNGINNRSLTNCFKATQSISCLETLHENSKDDTIINDMDSVCFDQSFDPNATPQKRKRKFVSPDQPSSLVKRKRDKSYSERKRKVSDFFKTPINYFSSRRRTIDATTFNQNLNESVLSSSGIFNIETVQNLSYCTENNHTPRQSQKRSKKNLFSRTFSSSKFSRNKSRKTSDLNATKLSFAEPNEVDGKEKLNASCFPDISFNPVFTNATSELGSENSRALRRTSVPAIAVLTSFLHSTLCFDCVGKHFLKEIEFGVMTAESFITL